MTDSVKRGYSVMEGAAYLGIGQSTMRELLASKKIGHKRIGTRRISIPKEELDDYYNSLGN